MSAQLQLENNYWDLKLTSNIYGKKNLQIIQTYEATAQRVSCNIKTIRGENQFFRGIGLPWFSDIFQQRLENELNKVQEYIINEVIKTEEVAAVTFYQTRQEGRKLLVSMQIKAISGENFTLEENLV